jgi:hypothetical protein
VDRKGEPGFEQNKTGGPFPVAGWKV